MAKVKDKSGLAKFNRFLSVVLILLVISTAVIVIVSPAKVAQQPETGSTEFVDEPVIVDDKPASSLDCIIANIVNAKHIIKSTTTNIIFIICI